MATTTSAAARRSRCARCSRERSSRARNGDVDSNRTASEVRRFRSEATPPCERQRGQCACCAVPPRMEADVGIEPLRDGGRLFRDLDLGVGAEDRAQRADLALQDGGIAHIEGDRVDDVDPQVPVPRRRGGDRVPPACARASPPRPRRGSRGSSRSPRGACSRGRGRGGPRWCDDAPASRARRRSRGVRRVPGRVRPTEALVEAVHPHEVVTPDARVVPVESWPRGGERVEHARDRRGPSRGAATACRRACRGRAARCSRSRGRP